MAKTKEMKAEKKERKKADAAQQKSLSWFAAKMLVKLKLQNERLSTTVNPGMPRGTLLGQKKDHDIWWYYRRLRGETTELEGALKRYDIKHNEITRDAVISEATDVANFAAAIAKKAVEDTR